MNPLDIDAINRVSPYMVSLAATNEYRFQTQTGTIYHVGFIPDDNIKSCESYQFFISRETIHHPQKDDYVKECVLAVLDEFFNQNTSVILYICETSDGKEAARDRLFVQWYCNYHDSQQFTLKTAHVEADGVGMYTAIIIRNDNPSLQLICKEFDDLATLLTVKPGEIID